MNKERDQLNIIIVKKEEHKHLNEQITKQEDMTECKPEEPSNNYLYTSGVSVAGLAIVGYLLYN